jgi:hypothetical protein
MRHNLVATTSGAVLVIGLLALGAGAGASGATTPGRPAGPASTSRVGAQVVVGQTGLPLPCAPGASTWVSKATGAAAPGYAVPGPGVITSVSHNANATAGSIRAVLMGPAAAPNDRTVLGYSPLFPVAPSTLNTFATRIAVPAGARLAMFITSDNMGCNFGTSDAADVLMGAVFDPTLASNFTPTNSFPQRRLNLSAVWEPDVDKDLYGDVTQDLCPQSPQTQAACPAPDTTITKAPAKRLSKRAATIRFTSVAGATFTCAVDGKAAKPCASPFEKRYRYGKHSVVVTAVSDVGIADPSPAVVTFKVRRPRSHH